MYITIKGDVLAKMYDFTAKEGNLAHIKISFNEGIMEFAATNGAALCRYSQKINSGEDAEGVKEILLPIRELFKKSDLKKEFFYFEKEDKNVFLVNQFKGIKYKIEPSEYTYPNYKMVCRTEKWTDDPSYAYFNPKYLLLMEDIMGTSAVSKPMSQNKSGRNPYSWYIKGFDFEYEVVLMPLIEKK